MQKLRKRWTAWMFAAALAISLTTGALAANLTEVIPIGRTAGIKMAAQGVIVVALDKVRTAIGEVCPASQAGIQPGDVLLEVDGEALASNSALQKKVSLSAGGRMTFKVKRNDKIMQLNAAAVQDQSGVYKLGLSVRDSVAGIGTITYVDPATGAYGSLGHGICDGDTGVLIPLREGSLMESSVSSVVKGTAGTPGSLQGEFNLQQDMGTVTENTVTGIFGVLTDDSYYAGHSAVPIATADQIQTGPATILSNVDGETVAEYSCEITKVYGEGGEYDRCMVLHITDPALLSKTGGIVQGMSGSPILQHGRLVGAVTHVLVSDPTRGYGVQIEKMLQEMETLT